MYIYHCKTLLIILTANRLVMELHVICSFYFNSHIAKYDYVPYFQLG